MENNYIQVKNLNYKYKDYLVLDDVSFDIEKGCVAAIIGPNGSGKTTLLKNIIGLYEPDSGEVRIDGKKPRQMRERMAYVPQRFDFERSIPITILEFLRLYKCGHRRHKQANTDLVLKSVGLEGMKDHRLGELSGGQFQRVMIARALLHEKDILILDEPSTGIDLAGERTVYDLITEINRTRQATCLIVSHELNIVNKYAKMVICLNKKLCCFGPPESVITPENLKNLFGESAGLYHQH
jgi:ABC-type Mn2+/Zn2+ transport system ATPase subunit